MRAVPLFPSIFTPLCVPELREVAEGLRDPHTSEIPLLGRPDWWAIWYRALGGAEPPPSSFGTMLATEHLDVTAALSGHGIAIGSPILFQREIEEGRLVAPNVLVANTGRAFWLVYPTARQHVSKIVHLRDWLAAEAKAAIDSAQHYLGRAVRVSE
jgi:LysR family glycine cleavage system transcriptional activator